jgi:dethiobiotin synthetase
MKGCFVTGTDTAVGKTLASTALLYSLQRQYRRVVGMKPVAAGATNIAGELTNEDALALRAASTIRVAPDLDNPFLLSQPVSPHIAAQRDGRHVDIGELRVRYQQLAQRADFVVVEGAGGFHVPLSDSETGADLATALALPVVLVVGIRLGCLNHALLTAEAIPTRGLVLAGWIANRIDPHMECVEENLAYLRKKLPAPLLADIPWSSRPDPSAIVIDVPMSWRSAA